MVSRLKIELAGSLVEVEGSEAFVSKIYGDFKEVLKSQSESQMSKKTENQPLWGANTQKGRSSVHKAHSTKKRTPKNPQILKDFDVYASPSAKDFVAWYNANSQSDRLLLVLRYLEKEKEIEEIKAEHITTCFEALQIHKNDFYQFLRDMKKNHGYFNIDGNRYATATFTISPKGKNRLLELGDG